MNIQKKLSLNKHPGDCVPYSLVAAKNVKVSNDDRMIVNEEGLEDCKAIANSCLLYTSPSPRDCS